MKHWVGIACVLALAACSDGSTPESATAPEALTSSAPPATSAVAVRKPEPSPVKALAERTPDQAQAMSEAVADSEPGTAAPAAGVPASRKPEAEASPSPKVQAKPEQQAKEVPAPQTTENPAPGHDKLVTGGTTSALPMGDANKGKKLAAKCMGCHRFDARRKLGPGLKGVVGRIAGKMPDMKYSEALAAADWRWTEANLARWLCDTKKAVRELSGNPAATTKMPPQRICDPQRQADLIAFLKTL